MIIKILWSRHLEFSIEQGHGVNWVSRSLDSQFHLWWAYRFAAIGATLCCVSAVPVDNCPAEDQTDAAAKQLDDRCDDNNHRDDDDDVTVARDARCPGDGTSIDYDQQQLDSFDRQRSAEDLSDGMFLLLQISQLFYSYV